MNIKKQPWPVRLLISLGLLMVTMPVLLNDYTRVPDFFRGFLGGAGLVFEITGLALMMNKKAGASCARMIKDDN